MGLITERRLGGEHAPNPAKQRKPEDRTLKLRQKKQAHKRAKQTRKTRAAYTNYPNRRKISAGSSTDINSEVIRTMEVKHSEEEDLKPPEELFNRQGCFVKKPFIPFLP